jgi:hypothetical protein
MNIWQRQKEREREKAQEEYEELMRLIRFTQNLHRGLDFRWAWTLSAYKSRRIR